MTINLPSDLPTKLVGIALLVAPLTQIMKRSFPENLGGWKSLALNFFLCAVAQLSTCGDPEQIRTLPFWVNVGTAAIAAAGVHGIGKGLGLFQGVFALPQQLQDPLQWTCPHVENDADGRPLYACMAAPGAECSWSQAQHPRFHAERIAMVTGPGPKMSEATAAAAAEAANVAPLFGPAGRITEVPAAASSMGRTATGANLAIVPSAYPKTIGLYKEYIPPVEHDASWLDREVGSVLQQMGLQHPQPEVPVPPSRDTPKEPSTALAKVDSLTLGIPQKGFTLMAKSFLASAVSLALSKVKSFGRAIWPAVLKSDEAKNIESSIGNFIKTDVGNFAVDAVSYVDVALPGASNAAKKAAAVDKLKADLKTAGHDVESIAESTLNLFIELAYTGVKGSLGQLESAFTPASAEPVTDAPAQVPEPAPVAPVEEVPQVQQTQAVA